MAILASELFGIFVLLAVIYFLGRPIVRGAIYFPTMPRSVETMLMLADVRSGQRIADIGSGDGRILIACAARGAYAVGYEINPILVWFSRRAIRRAGFGGRAAVHWKSFWRMDLGKFDTVFVYGIPYIMRDLQRKLERELRPGAKVVSNSFKFPGWVPFKTENHIRLYINS